MAVRRMSASGPWMRGCRVVVDAARRVLHVSPPFGSPSVRVTRKKYSDLPPKPICSLQDVPLASASSAPVSEIAPHSTPKRRARQAKSLLSETGRRRKRVPCQGDPPPDDSCSDHQLATPLPSIEEVEETRSSISRTRRRTRSELGSPSKQPRNTLAKEILTNLENFPHCILLTRVGQFYESYFDQAKDVAHLLGIKLTSRIWDKQNIDMCGFPIMHLDKYLKVLVLQHKRFVAMCEEFPHYQPGQKPVFERRVVRVITPGTLIDEPFLNHYENNYLLAIASAPNILDDVDDSHLFGLAWTDVSTGEFFTKTIHLESLKDHLARICPKEIVLPRELKNHLEHPVRQAVEDEDIFVSYSIHLPSNEPLPFPVDNVSLETDQPSIAYTTRESEAINILTSYMRENLLEHMPQLSTPSKEGSEERMQIDSHTIKALEIRESTREGGVTGSLLSAVKRTVTSSGTRLLVRRLCSPSTSVKEIQSRQALVEFFYTRLFLRNDVVQMLKECDDATRIVQKFLLSKGEPRDLLSINRTIEVWIAIQERLELERKMEKSERGNLICSEWQGIDALVSGIADLQNLSCRIALALHDIEVPDVAVEAPGEDDIPQEEKETQTVAYNGIYKWTVRPEFSDRLTDLHGNLNNFLDTRRRMERELQVQYNAPSLTLRTSPAQGMHVHIARAKRDQSKVKSSADFVNISESASTSSFFYQPWSQLGNQIVETTSAISNAEKEIFNMLRNEVKALATQLRRNARIMDELDVTIGFANLAAELRLVRPIIKDDATYEVTGGRHPTVELGLLNSGRVFTPNSVSIRSDSRLHVITGPNMAGKSTFLRQTALMAILAQTGSFVPAEHAVIGVVDKLFSRVGAKDDLFRDRSTFMVEMLETAEILRRATPRSLVIMDEVGRGTTVRDGLAIAFATVHHLVVHSRCRALFATHFHELADLLAYSKDNHHGDGIFRDVGFFCTDVHQTADDYFTYSHRLRPGVNRDSHGLKVAQLAGMPKSVVLLAKNILTALQGQQHMSPEELSLLGRSTTTTDR